ncbi:MAG: DUF4136 domain-containing protein, partial [Xanthomonadaceae bacterium]|nr:DUF4136 domain-containing protein [Xanthomonadaceae bacterium]
MMRFEAQRNTVLAVLGMLISACASQRAPDIRINVAPDADLSSYATFGFPEQTGTDRGGYETFVTDHFKSAVKKQMQARGYQYVEE